MAGRIMGWLLICDPAHQSLAQLGSVLKASKGSISTMTRILVDIGIAKRVSMPGDRRDYVVIPDGWLTKQMDSGQQRSTRVRKLAEDGLRVLAGTPHARQARLAELRDLYSFMERETPALLERWQRERDSRRT
jgi:DNA-binding transcriptional regulator GbsR (MarR family)